LKTLEKRAVFWYNKHIRDSKNHVFEVQMYKIQDKKQLTMDEFYIPFGSGLRTDNRWVKTAQIMPWELVEALYAESFSMEKGRSAISSRIAFGSAYIKEQENLTDEGTVTYLCENPYAQYFVGLKEFRTEPLFDASMMVHFRKRFTPEMIRKINEALYERMHPREKEPPTGEGGQPKAEDGLPEGGSDNKGVMILDATVAPSDIHYPTDLNLVNACREDTEKLIDRLWEYGGRKGHKTGYNRNKARRSFLKVVKQRKAKQKAMQRAVSEQIDYVEKSLETLKLLIHEVGEERLTDAERKRLDTIQKVYGQQRQMRDTGKHSCSDRIVSLRQPHVRCIMRGKAGRPYEFGQKLHLSVVKGFTFIEEQSYDNFNEGTRLKEAAERYRKRFGHYPEAILADTIYRNRENRTFCKEHGIRLSGPRLGRPQKDEAEEDKSQAYRDSVKRSEVESRHGIAKRRYGLDLIMAYLAETGLTEAALQILVMNVAHLLRFLLRLFWWAEVWLKKSFRPLVLVSICG
jgi:IS5 family transposase